MTLVKSLVCSIILISLISAAVSYNHQRKVYIIYMGAVPVGKVVDRSVHLNLLNKVLEGSSPHESLQCSYTKSFNGFAANLTRREMKKLVGMKGIVSVFPDRVYKLHTTRSWDFLKFDDNILRNPAMESDVIIGVIDTGIWSESESFSDAGLTPPPAKWKGVCHKIKCNNKIIGARYYPSNDTEGSPIDKEGHGTHVASTAAGRNVHADLVGLGKGVARGAVPAARIAMYKVCTPTCLSRNILFAFHDAIADGVDIISISLGSDSADRYSEDPTAIGAFHAMVDGILTSSAAGNSGPQKGTVCNVAPWLLSVAAATTDRRIVDKLSLSNGSIVDGVSINTYPGNKKPIVYLGDIGTFPPSYCVEADYDTVEDNIVFCTGSYDQRPRLYGARGMVMLNQDDSIYLDVPFQHNFPTIAVNTSAGKIIKDFIFSNDISEATIQKSEEVADFTAPLVASFSSRGPNLISRNILKPDISAPGVSILAAWPPNLPLATEEADDMRRSNFNMLSGTSMACPHATGAAAYVKSLHPNWSPAAIMSALITTATPMDPNSRDDAELSYGAGMINPVMAAAPGLIFDATAEDYAYLLCHEGYNITELRIIIGNENFTCDSLQPESIELNTPTMALFVNVDNRFKRSFVRTITNVGRPISNYTLTVNSDDNRIMVTVEPKFLSFRKLGERKTFVGVVSGILSDHESVASAALVWSNGEYFVRFPIVIYNY